MSELRVRKRPFRFISERGSVSGRGLIARLLLCVGALLLVVACDSGSPGVVADSGIPKGADAELGEASARAQIVSGALGNTAIRDHGTFCQSARAH